MRLDAGGTTRTKIDIVPGDESSEPSGFTEFNGALYFHAYDGTDDNELWKLDADGTLTKIDINVGAGSSFPGGFTEFNGALYFSATGEGTDRELWRLDADGTLTEIEVDPFGR